MLQMVPVLLKFADSAEPVDFDFSIEVISWTMAVGIFSFLVGVGQLGWLKSRRLGMFSTVVALLSALFILYEFL
jgi:hypothetical protein